MMASDFAPMFLGPVGYGVIELHRLLIDFRVQAFTSPCPTHYGGHSATMPSADFCSITDGVTSDGAIGVHLVRSQPPMAAASSRPFLADQPLPFASGYRSIG